MRRRFPIAPVSSKCQTVLTRSLMLDFSCRETTASCGKLSMRFRSAASACCAVLALRQYDNCRIHATRRALISSITSLLLTYFLSKP